MNFLFALALLIPTALYASDSKPCQPHVIDLLTELAYENGISISKRDCRYTQYDSMAIVIFGSVQSNNHWTIVYQFDPTRIEYRNYRRESILCVTKRNGDFINTGKKCSR